MINSQEIIERSFYDALLKTTVNLGYTVDPMQYQPVSIDNQTRFNQDMDRIKSEKGVFISVFGVGNNKSRGVKFTPRITVDSEGFYPGDIGMPRQIIDKEEGIGYTATEEPYEALDNLINIHLISDDVKHMRILHQILFWSIPQRGYLKPFSEEEFLFSGNIFLRVVNFYNIPDQENGLLEKIYQFEVKDCLLDTGKSPIEIPPIIDISCLIPNENIIDIHG